MNKHKHTSISENRLLNFESIDKKEISHFLDPKTGEMLPNGEVEKQIRNGTFKTGSKNFDRFLTMSDDEYRKVIASGETIPETEAERDIRQMVDGFQKAFDATEDIDLTDPKSRGFERMLGTLGRAMDEHFMPLVQKYEANPDVLLDAFADIGIREVITRDRKLYDPKNPDSLRRISSPKERLLESIQSHNRSGYDRALSIELQSGKTIEEVRQQYEEEMRRAPIGSKNSEDIEEMLSAIDRLYDTNFQLCEKLAKLATPEFFRVNGISFRLDPKDFEVVVVNLKREQVQLLAEQGVLGKKAGGDYAITIDGKQYIVRYDISEKEYEMHEEI